MKKRILSVILVAIFCIGLVSDAVYADVQTEYVVTGVDGVSKSSDRSDYSSDEVFANFRTLTAGNISPYNMFRSCSPYHDYHGRSKYASKLMEQNGIVDVINFWDNEDDFYDNISKKKYSYYFSLHESGTVHLLDTDIIMGDASFKSAIASGMKVLADNEGPYLVHCRAGKDRTGFFCALLEAFMGASRQEILDDYMLTYYNFFQYGDNIITQDDYDNIKSNTIDPIFREITGYSDVSSLSDNVLYTSAVSYLKSIGLNDTDLANIRKHMTVYRLKAPVIKTLKKKSKTSLTVKWRKDSDATGYQIRIKSKSSSKYYNVTSNKGKQVIKNLKSGTSYTVSVRAYNKTSSKTYYSEWGMAQKVKL